MFLPYSIRRSCMKNLSVKLVSHKSIVSHRPSPNQAELCPKSFRLKFRLNRFAGCSLRRRDLSQDESSPTWPKSRRERSDGGVGAGARDSDWGAIERVLFPVTFLSSRRPHIPGGKRLSLDTMSPVQRAFSVCLVHFLSIHRTIATTSRTVGKRIQTETAWETLATTTLTTTGSRTGRYVACHPLWDPRAPWSPMGHALHFQIELQTFRAGHTSRREFEICLMDKSSRFPLELFECGAQVNGSFWQRAWHRVFDVTSVGQRSSPWPWNLVKVEIKFHLECKLCFPFYTVCIAANALT